MASAEQRPDPVAVNRAREAARREAMSLDTLGPLPSRVIPERMRRRMAQLEPPAAPERRGRELDD